jgi:phage-related protein
VSTTVPLNFDIYARDHASSTFSRFGSSVSKSEKSVGTLRIGLGRLAGAFAGLAIIQKTTQFLSDSISEARESNKVGAQTQAVLKSTKNAANLSADAIGNLANKLSLKAGVDDEAIQSGENLLLTFRNIRDEVGKGNDIFTRATKIGLDMSVAMGTDLKSANIQLGKALNDPVKGITALTRVGVSFTQQQQDQIGKLVKHNHTLEAQKIILGELNKEFKGSAKAQADPADRARVAWENFQETVGLKLMPVLDKLLIWFVAKGLPAIQQFGGWLSDKLGPIISEVASWFDQSSQKGGELSSAFQRMSEVAKQVYAALYPIAVEIFQIIQRNWPQISATVKQVMSTIATVITAAAQLIQLTWKVWGSTISQYVEGTLRGILSAIKGVMQIIEGVFKVFSSLMKGDWKGAWDGVKEILKGALNIIKGIVQAGFAAVVALVKGIGPKLMQAMGLAWDRAKSATATGVGKVVSYVKGVPGKIKKAIGDLGQLLFEAGVDVVKGLINGIESWVGTLRSTAESLPGIIKDSFKSTLGISSPSKVMHEYGVNTMEGLINGITSKIQTLKAAMQSVTDMVTGLFGNPLAGENVNTVADIFRQQRSETGDATRLRNDIKKLLHKGLDMRFITDMISTGNLTALHALAEAPASQVRRFERGERRLERVERRSSGMLNQGSRDRVADLKEQRREYERMLDRLEKAVKKGIDGAHIVIDGHGNAHLRIRGGSSA